MTPIWIAVGAALVIGAAACGNTASAPPDVQVSSAVVTEGDEVTAAYVTLTNEGGADVLIGATSPAARQVVLHETVEQDGLFLMRRADGGLEVPAGGDLVLVPGGAHLMLEDLVVPLRAGDRVALELDLVEGGSVVTEAEVVTQEEINERLATVEEGS